jgi:hypothetical protein
VSLRLTNDQGEEIVESWTVDMTLPTSHIKIGQSRSDNTRTLDLTCQYDVASGRSFHGRTKTSDKRAGELRTHVGDMGVLVSVLKSMDLPEAATSALADLEALVRDAQGTVGVDAQRPDHVRAATRPPRTSIVDRMASRAPFLRLPLPPDEPALTPQRLHGEAHRPDVLNLTEVAEAPTFGETAKFAETANGYSPPAASALPPPLPIDVEEG